MERQLNWLENQINMIDKKSDNIQQFRRVNTQIQGMVGIKMIVFSLIGLSGIVVVNYIFFKLLKN